MMMVVVIGGVMCCGMSCVGGLGAWYLKDATLGGLLSPAVASSPEGSTPDGSPGPSTADPPAAGVPTDKAVYIWHKGCAAATIKKRFTILAGNANEKEVPVQLGCRSEPGGDWGTLWRFQKAKEKNLYYVRHEKSKKYLTASNKLDVFKFELVDAISNDVNIRWGQLWYIGKGSDGGVTLTLSQNALKNGGKDTTYRNLAWNDQFCNGDPGSHSNRQANDPWFSKDTDPKQTLWGIKVPRDANKMNNKC